MVQIQGKQLRFFFFGGKRQKILMIIRNQSNQYTEAQVRHLATLDKGAPPTIVVVPGSHKKDI